MFLSSKTNIHKPYFRKKLEKIKNIKGKIANFQDQTDPD